MVGLKQAQASSQGTSQVKIVQVSPYAMNRPGGVQTHVRDLSDWLRLQGHEVRIVAPPGHLERDDLITLGTSRSIKLHGTAFEISKAKRRKVTRCAENLRQWGAEIVHLHTPWTPMLAWQVWRALHLPTVATFHATLPESRGADPFKLYIQRSARYFHKRLDAVFVPSETPRKQWEDQGITPLPKVIPPAINLDRWSRGTPEPGRSLTLVYMGRLEARKGVQILLEAWREVTGHLADARLTIAGRGPDEAVLRGFVDTHKIEGVEFISPPSDAEAPDLISGADFLIAPAIHGESFGLVLIEALAAGTLPIAAANDGYKTVLTGPGKDLLVPPGNARALAGKILDLAKNPQLCQELRGWGQQQALRYDISQIGPVLVEQYTGTLARQR